jgi:hypothetical protein
MTEPYPARWPDIANLDRAELETEVAVLRHTLNAQRDTIAALDAENLRLREQAGDMAEQLDGPA